MPDVFQFRYYCGEVPKLVSDLIRRNINVLGPPKSFVLPLPKGFLNIFWEIENPADPVLPISISCKYRIAKKYRRGDSERVFEYVYWYIWQWLTLHEKGLNLRYISSLMSRYSYNVFPEHWAIIKYFSK